MSRLEIFLAPALLCIASYWVDDAHTPISRFGMFGDARSDEYADRVRGWLGEAEGKLQDVLRSINELNEKIRAAESRLRDSK